ncbi:MAG: hypothetical protein IIB37_07915 [Gemmatimonadetes bacterium]|jgi:hypothetical protein|nr:hypothetical protein [Gemmatimonadota bacterium]MCH8810260.1 hypothetical protein [Gemmatimonadota bacterium]
MSVEQKIQQLLRAACRVEREGNLHVAQVLRKMAEESLPAGGVQTLPSFECPED